jgi:hypothetical protein
LATRILLGFLFCSSGIKKKNDAPRPEGWGITPAHSNKYVGEPKVRCGQFFSTIGGFAEFAGAKILCAYKDNETRNPG